MENKAFTLLLFCLLVVLSCAGCTIHGSSPKERSYTVAMNILHDVNSPRIFDEVRRCGDVVALRIVAFAAMSAAGSMEAGPDVEFDNRLDEIALVAVHALFSIDTEEAKEAIANYVRAFGKDGISSVLFKEWEEEISKSEGNDDNDTDVCLW